MQKLVPNTLSRRDALRKMTYAAGASLLPSSARRSGAAQIAKGKGIAEATGNPGVDKTLAIFESAPLQTIKLNKHLAMLSGPGGNMLVLSAPEGALLVDTGIHPSAADVAKGAEAFAGKPVATVIDTHWHFDHTGGNEFFGSHGARILAHENTRQRLSHNQMIEAFNYTFPASPSIALPVVTFTDVLRVYWGDESLHLQYVPPAHTDSDILVHIPNANVLHTGDIFFNGFYPAIDYSTKGWIGGMVAAEDRALACCDTHTRIVPGHGPMGTMTDLNAAREMLGTVQGRIERLLDAGKSVDEIVSEAPTRDLDDSWGKGLYDGNGFTRLVAVGIQRYREDARGQSKEHV